MLTGIYCSTTGLNAMTQKMNTIADNVANVNTEGFKQEKITFKPFLNEINGAISAGKYVDFSAGGQKETGRAYDFAINGDAFFTVQTDQGDRYIRNGSFNCDVSGYLTDKNGNRIAGVSGSVKMVDGKPDQKFALAAVANKETLVRQGEGFTASAQTVISPANFEVSQGRLETSNVDLIHNISEMIMTSRNYSLNTKMLMSMDELLKKAANDIGTIK
jgi:flagellar basal-body rod protein FlgG